jgi:hypothetical protein
MMNARPVRTFARVLLAGLLVAVAACETIPTAPQAAPRAEANHSLIGSTLSIVDRLVQTPDVFVQQTIGPAGGTVSFGSGGSISFPAGALAEATQISVLASGSTYQVNLGPEGIIFPDSARPTLTFTYSSDGLLGSLFGQDLHIVYVDGGTVQEVLQTQTSLFSRTVQAKLDHFSIYAIATE